METTQLFETIKARRISPPPSLAVVSPSSKAYVAPDPPQPAFLSPQETEPIDLKPPAFVAREDELVRLNSFLDVMLASRGQAVFVIGEAGRGKTALVQEFTLQAQMRQADLIVASGNCNAYTGMGDPYLPFREILGLLTGDVEARWAAGAISQAQAQRLWAFTPYSVQAMVNYGPDLIDTFIPGSALLVRATAVASGPSTGSGQSDTAWLASLKELTARHAASQSSATVQQSDLFEQFAKVIKAAARRQPLLLVVDDLQWADSGSINLGGVKK